MGLGLFLDLVWWGIAGVGGNPLFTESHPMQSQVGFSIKFFFFFSNCLGWFYVIFFFSTWFHRWVSVFSLYFNEISYVRVQLGFGIHTLFFLCLLHFSVFDFFCMSDKFMQLFFLGWSMLSHEIFSKIKCYPMKSGIKVCIFKNAMFAKIINKTQFMLCLLLFLLC